MSVFNRNGFRAARVRLFAGALMLSVGAVFAATGAGYAANANHLRISKAQIGKTHNVKVNLNKSLILDLPRSATEVIVSNPGIATVILRSKRRAIVQGISRGDTNIFFLDSAGRKIAVLDVSVGEDATLLVTTIRRLIPGSNIAVESFGERVVLSGSAASTDDVTKATAIAGQFAGGEENVVSVVNVSGNQQVMLKVTIAEVEKEVVTQLGLNLSASFAGGSVTSTVSSAPTLGGASGIVANSGLTVGASSGGNSITATLRALSRHGAMKTLAEPTLTAMSGKEAEFLAGGEFPIATGIDDDKITFEFKEFGVNLKFMPVVRSNGLISLDVETSVSELSTEGGFTIGSITIPATKKREAKTSVQLASGQTLALGGLLQESVRQQINQLPGLSKLPILGALFRSRDYIRSKTELIILVTPYLATPGQMDDYKLPTSSLAMSGTAEGFFLGRMEKLYGVNGVQPNMQLQGNVGFLWD